MASLLLAGSLLPAAAQAPADPRVGLRAGWMNAGEAARNMELLSNTPRPAGFIDPQNMNDFSLINADLAFDRNTIFLGGFNGVQIFDATDVRRLRLRGTIVCPGGQGDVSVHRNLLFMSVEEPRGRLDCGAREIKEAASAELSAACASSTSATSTRRARWPPCRRAAARTRTRWCRTRATPPTCTCT